MSDHTPVTLTQPDDSIDVRLPTGHTVIVFGDGGMTYTLPGQDPAVMNPLTLAPGLTAELFDWDAHPGVWYHTGTPSPTPTACGAHDAGDPPYQATCTRPHGHPGAHHAPDPVTHDGRYVAWHGDHTLGVRSAVAIDVRDPSLCMAPCNLPVNHAGPCQGTQ